MLRALPIALCCLGGAPASLLAQASFSVTSITATSATVTLNGHSESWYLEVDFGSTTTCTAQSGSTAVNLADLTPGTNHLITAWPASVSNCQGPISLTLAGTSFTTLDQPSLTAGTITKDGATLTIANHSGNWYYKYTSPTGGECSSSAVSGTSTTVSGLSTGTTYTFKAYSDGTCSSEVATASEFTTKPDKVTGLTVTGLNESLSLRWDAETGATSYTVQWKSAGQGFGGEDQATSTSNSHTISTSLDNGIQYTVRVRATTAGGDGQWSDEATGTPTAALTFTAEGITLARAVLRLLNHTGTWYVDGGDGTTTLADCVAVAGASHTLTNLTAGTSYSFSAYSASDCAEGSKLKSLTFTTLSGKVTDLTATAGSGASIDLSWTAVMDVTGYKAQYKSGAQDWSSTRQLTATSNSLNVASNHLTANTAYTFRVVATYAKGDAAWSDEVVATPVEATLAASNIGADSATLTIANHTGTWYYKRITPTAGTCSSGVATASTTVSGLSPGQPHTFSAYADNQCTGTALATTPRFLTKPGKAAGVSATAANAALDVAWTATTGASSYKVQWRSSSDSGWDATNRQIAATTASANIPSLTNGTTYTVRVAAVNDAGDGAWSDTATGTPSGSTLRLVTGAANGGVFAIAGHSGTWYSKVTPPADATCETNASTGKAVTGKSSGTGYTITAYSDSSCNTRLTSLDFTTRPAKVAGVTVTARAASLGVSWTAETGNAAVSYKVQWRSSSDTGWDAASRQIVTTKASAAITGLTNGTSYTIRVAGTTAAGDGGWSDNATGAPSATAVTLTAETLTAQGGLFNLSNQSADWWYKFGPTENCNKGPANGVFVNWGLSSGTAYTLTVYGNSSCTTKLTSLDFLTLPGKTAGVTLANRGASLGVSWTAVTGAASYKVQWKSGNESFGSSRETTSTTTAATIPSLTNNTSHTVRVAAVNASGDGAWSDTVTGAPSVKLTASDVTSTGATLTVAGWSGNWYLSGRGGGSYSLACTQVSGTTHSPALSGNTTYEYKAYDTDRCTGRALASTSFTTPGAVTLIADNIGMNSVMLYLQGWETLPTTRVSYAAHEAGSSSPHRSCLSQGRPVAHTPYNGLESGTTYTARYFRGNSCAAIEEFASVTFTTLSDAAPELSVSNVTNTGATLTLSNHTGNWWYENDDIANSCTAVTGGATTVHLSGLTASTNHAFTAWSHAGCADATEPGVWYSTKVFTTAGPVTVSVSGKTSTGLTVNLRGYTQAAGYPAQWSVAVGLRIPGGVAVDAPCQTLPRATTSATVTSLEAGKQYTIQVYKVAKCINPVNIVNETPVTMVSLVTGNVGPSSASLRLDHHEQDWSYRGARIGGQASSASASQAGDGTSGGASGGAQTTAQASAAGQDVTQCRAVPAGQRTVELENLAPNASYTFNAYGGQGCKGPRLAQVSFATPPSGGDIGDVGPSFGSVSVGDVSYRPRRSIEPLVLPEAENGSGDLAYSLLPELPDGLAFDPEARTVSGTPTVDRPRTEYTYAVVDDRERRAELTFVIAVVEAPVEIEFGFPEDAIGDFTFRQNTPVAPFALPAAEGGEGEIAYRLHPELPDGLDFDRATREISGTATARQKRTEYTLVATDERGDTAETTFGIAVTADLAPSFGDTDLGGLEFTQHAPIEPFPLPEAEGGDGELTYSLAPDPPAGLALDEATHTLSGAPSEALDETRYVWTAVDADGDAAELAFTIAVAPDLVPSFGDAVVPDRSSWKQNLPVEPPLTLPEAEGGDGELAYSLVPDPPAGLTLDLEARTLSGTPAEAQAETPYTWTAVDADGDEAELTFTIAVEADFAPSFGGARIPPLRLSQYVAMEPLALPPAAGGDGELTYAVEGALPAGLSFDAETRTLAGTPMERVGSRSYEYTATDSDPRDPDVASLSFSIEVDVSAAEKAILGDALAAQGRALLTGATEAIGSRFRNRDAGAGGAGGRFAPGGAGGFGGFSGGSGGFGGGFGGFGGGPGEFDGGPGRFGVGAGAPGGALAGGGSAWGFGRSRRPLSFALPLAGENGAAPGRWALWGATSARSFDGTSEAGRYDGSMTSLYIGADGRLGARWLAGAAVSRNSGGADYDAEAAGGNRGRLSTNLTGFYPYLRGQFDSGLELWAIGGWGSGEAKNRRDVDGASAESSDLSMSMVAAGLRRTLGQRESVEFALVGGAGMLNLSTDSGSRTVDGLDADATQARVAFEIAGRGAAVPYVQVGARMDDAGSQQDTGLELVGGVRYGGRRLDFEARARWLSTGSGDDAYEEFGGAVRLEFRPRDDGAGFRLNLAPAWGEAGVAGGFLNGGQYDMLSGSGMQSMAHGAWGGVQPSLAVEGELGYGIGLRRGVLLFGGGYRRDAWGLWERVGLEWEAAPRSPGGYDLRLKLDWQPATAATRAGFLFDVLWGWRF